MRILAGKIHQILTECIEVFAFPSFQTNTGVSTAFLQHFTTEKDDLIKFPKQIVIQCVTSFKMMSLFLERRKNIIER